jgi:hypothetical protein
MKPSRLPICLLTVSILLASGAASATELQAGYWQFWKTDKAAKVGKPTNSFCLTAEEAKNPIALIGDVPGDSSCEVRELQKISDTTSNFDLVCNEGAAKSKSTSIKTGNGFVTASVELGSFKKSYVHGVRVEAVCTK